MSKTTKTITVKQVRSAAGRLKAQHGTLVGLGLGKLNKVRTLQDTPEIRGMVNSVKHLVTVIE